MGALSPLGRGLPPLLEPRPAWQNRELAQDLQATPLLGLSFLCSDEVRAGNCQGRPSQL